MIARTATFLATFGYSGLIRPAPGTWGTVAGVPFAWLLGEWGGAPVMAAAAVAAFVIGWWAAQVHMTATGNMHDPSEIVIDEVAGLWVACIAVPENNWLWLLAAFLLFRLFDIWKPGPIGWADRRIKGALGVMVDDIVAGVAAALCLLALGQIPGVA